MMVITVGGVPEKRRAVCRHLESGISNAITISLDDTGERGLPAPERVTSGDVLIVDGNVITEGLEPDLTVLAIDIPLEELGKAERRAADFAELILVELGPSFEGRTELGLERELKSVTGAKKVLLFDDRAGRERVFRKVVDIALSRTGGEEMPEDVPEEVLEAVNRESKDGKMTCARAHRLAEELGVPVPLVGRALDLCNIKIKECQLGCF